MIMFIISFLTLPIPFYVLFPYFSFILSFMMISLEAMIPITIGVIISIIHNHSIALYFIAAPEQIMKGLECFCNLSILVTSAFWNSGIRTSLY